MNLVLKYDDSFWFASIFAFGDYYFLAYVNSITDLSVEWISEFRLTFQIILFLNVFFWFYLSQRYDGIPYKAREKDISPEELYKNQNFPLPK